MCEHGNTVPLRVCVPVVDETADLSYVLDTEEMQVSWAYRLEVDGG